MSTIVSWGGDPVVVATREEIGRSAAVLGQVESRLLGEVEPFDFFDQPLTRVLFAVQLPLLLLRIEQLKWACTMAGDNYISGEARIAGKVHWLTELIAAHPILDKLVPKQYVEKAGLAALGVAVGAQWFNGGLSKMVAREVVDVYPALTGLSGTSGTNASAGAHALLGQTKGLPILKAGTPEFLLQRSGPKLAAPTGIADLAKREKVVHRENEATIRIERYTHDGKKLFVVYVPGTREKSVLPNSDPFDISNAVALVGNPESAASHDAVVDAIKREGIKSSDQVVLVGYSQGGTIAAEIAKGHHGIKASALITFGAPIAQLHLPAHLPVMALEHTNDVVPALSGAVNPVTENWVTVEREVPMAVGELNLHAHRIGEYVHTANLVDHDNSETNIGAHRIRAKILDLFKGFEFSKSTEYQYVK